MRCMVTGCSSSASLVAVVVLISVFSSDAMTYSHTHTAQLTQLLNQTEHVFGTTSQSVSREVACSGPVSPSAILSALAELAEQTCVVVVE